MEFLNQRRFKRYARRAIKLYSADFIPETGTHFNQAKPTKPVYRDIISQSCREDFYSPFRGKREQYGPVLCFVKWKSLIDKDAITKGSHTNENDPSKVLQILRGNVFNYWEA